jgi:hypothetical protein
MERSHIFGNGVLTLITKVLFNSPFVDSQSGMWIFRREIWNYLDVRSSGMPFSQELKIEAYCRGFRCAEVPIEYRTRAGESKLNIYRDGSEVILHLFKKRFSMFFSNPPRVEKREVIAIDSNTVAV